MTNYSFCVGINDYSGSSSDLSGCVNDALDWSDLLTQRGYRAQVMLDGAVTRDSFLGMLEGLVSQLRYRDRLVVTYSGHGSWIPDSTGDEIDGRDEVLVMADFNYVTDDDLAAVFSRKPWGARIVLVSDSCHSGSVNRLVADGSYTAKPTPRFLPPRWNEIDEADLPVHRAIGSTSKALLLSGCHDTEYSYDAWFSGRPNGAFTRAALDTFSPGLSFNQWHARIRTRLPSSQYPQTPQIDGSWHQRRWTALD